MESEDIGENEEYEEIQRLLDLSNEFKNDGDMVQAMAEVDEAIEINENYFPSLIQKARLLVLTSSYTKADSLSNYMLKLDDKNPYGYFIKGEASFHLGHYRESAISILRSLERDLEEVEDAMSVLVNAVAGLLMASAAFKENMQMLDVYTRLSELGLALYSSSHYLLAIHVLQTAIRFETNQYGVTMRIYSTLGHAYSALKHIKESASSYSHCHDVAMAAHDYRMQTVSLISLASVHWEADDPYLAIIAYERLINLKGFIERESITTAEDMWSKEFQGKLFINVSVAYHRIGYADHAIKYAWKYFEIYPENEPGFPPNIDAPFLHRHLGILYEITGNFSKSVEQFEASLDHGANTGSDVDIALAYGHIGGSYCRSNRVAEGLDFHAQQLKLAEKLNYRREIAVAYEMLGDSQMVLENYDEAEDAFSQMHKYADRNSLFMTTALYKIGNTHLQRNQKMRAIYYYGLAERSVGEGKAYFKAMLEIQFGLACSLKTSLDFSELERARKCFEILIEKIEEQILGFVHETAYYPHNLVEKLSACYDGAQDIDFRIGSVEDALVLSENHRIFMWNLLLKRTPLPARFDNTELLRHREETAESMSAFREKLQSQAKPKTPGRHLSTRGYRKNIRTEAKIKSVKDLADVVNHQNATVICCSVTSISFYAWVLQPWNGLVKHYNRKSDKEGGNVQRELATIFSSFHEPLKNEKLFYITEKRDFHSDRSLYDAHKKIDLPGPTDVPSEDIFKTLYTKLFGPMNDLLQSLNPDSPLIVIPDKCLSYCPFPLLRDWKGKPLHESFSITVLPCVTALRDCVQSEISDFQRVDGLNYNKVKLHFGGLQTVAAVGNDDQTTLIPSAVTTASKHHHSYSAKVFNPKLVSATSLANQSTDSKENPNTSTLLEGNYQQINITRGDNSNQRNQSGDDDENGSFYTRLSSDIARRELQKCQRRRQRQKLRRGVTVGTARNASNLLRLKDCSTLTSRTSTGTDLLMSTTSVPQFQQISNQENCFIIGNPKLPNSLSINGMTWRPNDNHDACQKELDCVGQVLKCDAITGEEATKTRFLDTVTTATIVHIATFLDLSSGAMCFASDRDEILEGSKRNAHHYVLDRAEIGTLHIQAKLVVLSGGWSNKNSELNKSFDVLSLATAFISAGAQNVLILPLPLPSEAVNTFYKVLYTVCHYGTKLTAAVTKASEAALSCLRKHEFLSKMTVLPYILVGKDVDINLFDIKKAMLDQTVDDAEASVSSQMKKPPLNPKPLKPVLTLIGKLEKLQVHLVPILLLSRASIDDVITELSNLVTQTIQLQKSGEKGLKKVRMLSQTVTQNVSAIRLLRFLTFHFQLAGSSVEDSSLAVVHPHWDPDSLLSRSQQALQAMQVLKCEPDVLEAFHDAFPMSQRIMSYMIDLLVITKHSPDIQLQITDTGIIPLWSTPLLKVALAALGFQQVGTYLQFTRSERNVVTLTAILGFLIALSESKSTSLIQKLDVSQLGNYDEMQTESTMQSHLPTMLPTLLPDEKMLMRVPWSSRLETEQEMEEKVSLATKNREAEHEFKVTRADARKSTKGIIQPLANLHLQQYGAAQSKPQKKVKVIAGGSPSKNRVSVEFKPKLDIAAREYRREHSHTMLQVRQDEVTKREQDTYKNYMLRYTDKVL